jgi:hypothetical protein
VSTKLAASVATIRAPPVSVFVERHPAAGVFEPHPALVLFPAKPDRILSL